ncbi:MAG: TrbC family F-type conjugative pilus assembly protein [Desulfobaccales bacterium]
MQARVYGRLLIILACFFLMINPAIAIQDLEEIAAGIARDMPTRMEEFQELSLDLARREKSRIKNQAVEMAPESLQPTGNRILLFVTLGEKPEGNLEANRRLFKDIREISPEAIVVLRGLPQEARSLGDLFKYMRQLVGKDGPQVMLNPVLFRKYNVAVSPTLVYERDGAAVAWGRGIIDTRWLKKRVEQEKATGDLGKWGQTLNIAERDFIEEMKSRLAGIDWEAKKAKAIDSYWQKQRFLELPQTKQEKVFHLDAVYQVERDFVLPDGKVVARAGQKIDLFKIVPPTFMLVVFDAADPKQLEWAVKTGKEYAGQPRVRVKYITTKIPDQEHGWMSLSRLYDVLDAPLFLLNEPVRDRFKLQHVPSTVRYDKAKHKFEVKEISLSDRAKPRAVQAGTPQPPLPKGSPKMGDL